MSASIYFNAKDTYMEGVWTVVAVVAVVAVEVVEVEVVAVDCRWLFDVWVAKEGRISNDVKLLTGTHSHRTSARQRINAPTHHRVNASTHQRISASMHQCINAPTHQHSPATTTVHNHNIL